MEIGTRVRVIACTTGHEFNIGEEVTRVAGKYDGEYDSLAFKSDYSDDFVWYMSPHEYEILSCVEEDNYKLWYEEAIIASNEEGFACMSAADVIKYQAAEIRDLESKVKLLEKQVSDFGWEREYLSNQIPQDNGGWK